MTPALYGILRILFLIIAVLLILVILVQRGRGGGLVGAFGGPGGSSAFGAKTGDVFTVITVVMAVLFLVIGCLLAFRPSDTPLVEPSGKSAEQTTVVETEVPGSSADATAEPEQEEETPDK